MRKTTSLAGVVALTTAFASPAFAQNQNYGDFGLYLAAGVNRVNASFRNSRDVTVSESESSETVRVGYMFPGSPGVNGWFGLELGYLNFGDFKTGKVGRNTEVDISANGFTLAAIGSFRAAKKVDIYGRLGAFMVDTDSNSVINGSRVSDSGSSTEPFFAIGAELDQGRWNFYGEFLKVKAGDRDLEADILSIGVKYEFEPYLPGR